MTNFTGTRLTALGRALFAEQGREILFTRAETGKGVYEEDESVEDMVSLKEMVQEFPFSSVEKLDDTDVCVKFTVSNRELTEEYLFTEVGVYAQGLDGREVLYAVCYAVPEDADYIHAYNNVLENQIIIALRVTVSSDTDVTMVIDSGIYALNKDFLQETDKLKGVIMDLGALIATQSVGYIIDSQGHRLITNNGTSITLRRNKDGFERNGAENS